MKNSLGISAAAIAAASLFVPGAVAQNTPKARSAQVYTFQKGAGAGYLGIGGVEITAERAKALNLKEERGVEVSSVAGDGPAAKAGIQQGDVLLEYNGTPVEGNVQLQRLVSETPVGRQVKIVISRNGATQTVTATIGEKKGTLSQLTHDGPNWSYEMPAIPRMPEFSMPRMEVLTPSPALGIFGEPLAQADQLAEFFGVTDGVLVRSVNRGSAAEKAGIKAGDVITKIEETHISNTADITRTLRSLRGTKSTVTVTVVRNRKEMPIAVTVTIESGATTPASLVVVNC